MGVHSGQIGAVMVFILRLSCETLLVGMLKKKMQTGS